MKRVWTALIGSALWASDALAQTGPVATVPDNSGVLPVFAVVLFIGVIVLIVALFEPWKWFKGRRRK